MLKPCQPYEHTLAVPVLQIPEHFRVQAVGDDFRNRLNGISDKFVCRIGFLRNLAVEYIDRDVVCHGALVIDLMCHVLQFIGRNCLLGVHELQGSSFCFADNGDLTILYLLL